MTAPTPWTLERDWVLELRDANGDLVGHIVREEEAFRILRCVNAEENVLAYLNKAVSLLADLRPVRAADIFILAAIRDAISALRGEKHAPTKEPMNPGPMQEQVLTKEEFETLKPRTRGYVVYMAGNRDDQPNVPNEKNPYPAGSKEHEEWNEGQRQAILQAQDNP